MVTSPGPWRPRSRCGDPRGDAAGILAIIEDITEFRKAEQIATRRTDQMRTVSEIARDATSTLDLDDLLTKAVNYVRDRFGFYHASVFLLDPSGEYAILRQSTGEAGAKMMQAGHRLIVGSLSIVGQATGKNQPVVSNDVLNDPSYYPNPLLPGTRAELSNSLAIREHGAGCIGCPGTHEACLPTRRY